MNPSSIGVSGVCLALVACAAPDQTSMIRVHDPTALSLEFPAEEGSQTLLPASASPVEVRVPATWGRRRGAGEVDAIRTGAGGIALRCSTCLWTPPTTIVTSDGRLTTFGRAGEAVVVDHDLVRVKIAYRYDDLATGTLRSVGAAPNVLEVVTPASNVVDVRTRPTSSTGAGIALMLAGVAVGALGSYALASRSSAAPDHQDLLLGTGIGGIALGGAIAIGGGALLLPAFSREGTVEGPR